MPEPLRQEKNVTCGYRTGKKWRGKDGEKRVITSKRTFENPHHIAVFLFAAELEDGVTRTF